MFLHALVVATISARQPPTHQLSITARYPPAVIDACNATINYAIVVNPSSVVTSNVSFHMGAPMSRTSHSTWAAVVTVPDGAVGQSFVVTFELAQGAAPASDCLAACPPLGFNGVIRNFGSPNLVELMEDTTRLEVWPYFCTFTGRVSQRDMHAPQLNDSRRIYTYTPPGIVENPLPRAISLAVLHDGQILNAAITSMIDTLVLTGDVRELLVVGVSSVGSNGDPSYRARILTPSTCDATCTCPPSTSGSSWYENCTAQIPPQIPTGGGADYLAFIKDSLLPSVRTELTVSFSVANTVSWGYSIGGLTAWYHAYAAPATFGAVIAGSPALWWNCGKHLTLGVQAMRGKSRVYIDVGRDEGPVMNIPARNAYEGLRAEGWSDARDVWLTVSRGDFHELNSWVTRMPRALKAVLPGSLGDLSHYEPPRRVLAGAGRLGSEI